MQKKIIVVGNWKQNPPTLDKAKQLFIDIRNGCKAKYSDIGVVIVPPVPFISELRRLSPSGRLLLGAQDVSLYDVGAHTGEVAPTMLESVGAEFIIVGHSERRANGETDEVVQKKVAQVVRRGRAILCVGEHERGKADYFGVVDTQLRTALQGLPPAQVKRVVIAYEPVWAIGTGQTATVEMVEEMKIFIKKTLTNLFDRKIADAVPVLYGGSVKANNTEDLLRFSNVDGFLVGGASLKATEFINIIATAQKTYGEKNS